ncbi:MAG TPA: methyltransferase domain-containing protein [Candidatus Mcinerneyibacterium sp.]|nr:methyltransferase domain-containing protein [Candidatus Mcinerneyibacterium sp.]
MNKDIITELFTCTECGSNLKNEEDYFLCENCDKKIPFQDSILDFGVDEQKYSNNWSNTTSEEEAMKWINSLIEQGYLNEDDIKVMQKSINHEDILKNWDRAVDLIRKEYYNSDNEIIVDLASGMASVLNEKLGEKIDFKKLEGKTIILTDLSKTVLKKVRKRLKNKIDNLNLIYAVCDVSNIPMKENSVDFISSAGVFSNSEEGLKILDNCKRILNNNSKLNIFEFLSEDESRTQKLKIHNGGDIEFTTPERFEKVLDNSNFNNISVSKMYEGKARLRGDMFPLKDEKTVLTFIEAEK